MLGYLSLKLNAPRRESCLSLLHRLEILDKSKDQAKFFDKYRGFQPVLRIDEAALTRSSLIQELQNIFLPYGWSRIELNERGLPSVAALARKIAPGVADVLYNFIYRLTSSTVHFSPQWLLNSGWGDVNDCATFSVAHLSPYYKKFCQLYGVLLFCFYFELFDNYLTPSDSVRSIVVDLRREILLDNRWPEMITFEVMNKPVPQVYREQPILALLAFQQFAEKYQHGFIPQTPRGIMESSRRTGNVKGKK